MWNWTQNVSASSDQASSITIDPSGNLYVAGYDSAPGLAQWRVVKIYPNSTTAWNWTQDPTPGSGDVANSITIGPSGNLYVAGYDQVPGNYEWRVVNISGPPRIVSWDNNVTGNSALSFNVDPNANITFNATADQSGTWTWKKDGAVNQTNASTANASFSTSFSTAGVHNVSVEVSNNNGTSDNVTWSITVNTPPIPEPYAVQGKVYNETAVAAGADTNVTVNVTNATKYYTTDFANYTTCSLNTSTAADGSYTVDLADCGSGKYFRGDWLNVSAVNKSKGAYGEATGNVSTNTSVNDTRINVTWSLKPLWRNAASNRSTVGYQQPINLSAQGVDGRNLTNATLFTNESGGFVPSGSIQGGGNVLNDLSATDPGGWLDSTAVRALVYASANDTVYVAADAGKFGVYYRGNNTLSDLSATDTGDWLGANSVKALAYDSVNQTVYLGAGAGKFGAYYLSNNTTVNISESDIGNWLGGDQVNALAYDSSNGFIYLGATNGKFGLYNISNNTTVDLSATDTGDWLSTLNINATVYDPSTGFIYIGADSGRFGVYNNSNGTLEDLSATDTGNWLGFSGVTALAYDSAGQRIYLGAVSGKFGVYKAGTATDLSSTDTNPTANWLGTAYVNALAYDSPSRLLYLGASGGKFGVYSAVANIATDLSSTDPGDWLFTNTVNALASDPVNHLVYLGADTLVANVKFGVYDRTARVNFPLPNSAQWLWSNFTWLSNVTPSSTTVGWWINYTDEDGRTNNTTLLAFRVVPAVTNWSNNVTNSTNLSFSVELASNNSRFTSINFTINASEAVNWSWFVNGTLSQGGISSPAVKVSSFVWEFNYTGTYTVTANGTNATTGDGTEVVKWTVTVNDTLIPDVLNNTTAQLYPQEVVQGSGVAFSVRIIDLGNVTNVTFRINGPAYPNGTNLSASQASGTPKNGTWNATLVTTGLETGFYNWTSITARDSTGNLNNTTSANLTFWVVIQRNITLFPTRNLFALPVDRLPIDGVNSTAEQTCANTPLYMVSKFKRPQQSWQSHICGILAGNFDIETLRGYWASAPTANASGTNVLKQGFELPAGSQTIEAGWNLVGSRNATYAAGICNSVGPAAVAVAEHNTSSNSYKTHMCGLQANNFTVGVSTGYWVYVNNQVNWAQ